MTTSTRNKKKTTSTMQPESAPQPATSSPAESVESVASKTAIVTVRVRKPGRNRRAAEGSLDVVSVRQDAGDPDDDSTSVSVELLRAPEFHAIIMHDRYTRDILRAEQLPAGRRFASGAYLVPMSRVEEIFQALAEAKTKRDSLVTEFLAAYPRIAQEAADRLKDAFEVKMFPGASLVEGKVQISERGKQIMAGEFSLDYELEVADRAAGVRAATGLSAAFVEKELKRAKESGAQLADEIRDGLRVAFAQLVDRATDMLKPAEGEKRVFRGENLERIQAFLASFSDRDVTGDGDLAEVVDQARDLLKGVDPATLKGAKEKDTRQKLGEALAGVQAVLAPMVVNKAKRKIDLEAE